MHYNHARAYLEQTLEKEAEEKIRRNERSQSEIQSRVSAYNQAIAGINSCLQAMQLYEHLLPAIGNADFIPVSTDAEPLNFSLTSVDVSTSNGKLEAIEM